MNEDARLNDFLKERLASGIPGEPPRLDAILDAASAAAQARTARRSRVRLWGALLAAASVAALGLLAVHLRVSPTTPPRTAASVPSPEQTVVGVIDLLSMADGDSLEVGTNSVADVLLAWQDAPYRDAISGLFAESEAIR